MLAAFDERVAVEWSRVSDSDFVRSRGGTRFRLFAQPPFLKPYQRPVTARISSPVGTVGPGPADDRMHVVVPIGKRSPYGIARGSHGLPVIYLPPWTGPIEPPALPDAIGNFDGIRVDAPEFEAAHVYGCVRWVLDVWERFLGQRVEWHFRRDYASLEISLLPELDNSHAGYGFLEVGADVHDGELRSFGLNFDVVAHEVGHLIIYSLIGVPTPGVENGEYQGFHESAADLVALFAAAHFEPVIDHLFATTHGNLYTLNELNRFAELSEQTQIRLACNLVKLSEFSAGWDDEHDLSLPLTGAIFDILCDVYHRLLIERGLIADRLVRLVAAEHRLGENVERIQAGFDIAFAADPMGFRNAFLDARECVGLYLAQTWQRLSVDRFSYARVGATLLAIDRELGMGRFREAIESSFRWREIGTIRVGPRLSEAEQRSHTRSPRTIVPQRPRQPSGMSYRERWMSVHKQ